MVIFLILLNLTLSDYLKEFVIHEDIVTARLTKVDNGTQWITTVKKSFEFKHKYKYQSFYGGWLTFSSFSQMSSIKNIIVLKNGEDVTDDLIKEITTVNDLGHKSHFYTIDYKQIKLNEKIELSYERHAEPNYRNIGQFYFQNGQFKVKKAELNIIVEKSLLTQFKYTASSFISKPKVSEAEHTKKFSWVILDPPKYENEPLSGYTREKMMFVEYSYSQKSWYDAFELNDYNLKYARSTKDMYGVKAYINKLELNGLTDEEKIRKVYLSVQKEFRYAYINLHEDGYIPSSNQKILNDKAADCKDYSKFMLTIFNTLGYEAYGVSVQTKDRNPFNPIIKYKYQFNHQILLVETKDGKSYYLDGTGRYFDIHEIRDDVQGTIALKEDYKNKIFTPIQIPLSSADDNQFNEIVEGTLENGSLTGNILVTYIGTSSQDIRQRLAKSNDEELLEYFKNVYKNDNSLITIHSLEKVKTNIYNDTISIRLKFSMSALEESLEPKKSLFGFRINFIDQSEYLTYRNSDRKFDYVYKTPPQTYSRSIKIKFKEPIKNLDYIPENYSTSNEFFDQKINYQFKNKTLTMSNIYKRFKNRIPVKNKELINTFFESLYEQEQEYITYFKK